MAGAVGWVVIGALTVGGVLYVLFSGMGFVKVGPEPGAEAGAGQRPHDAAHFECMYTGMRSHWPCAAHEEHVAAVSMHPPEVAGAVGMAVVGGVWYVVAGAVGWVVVGAVGWMEVGASTVEVTVYPATEEAMHAKAKTDACRAWLLTLCKCRTRRRSLKLVEVPALTKSAIRFSTMSLRSLFGSVLRDPQ